MDNIYGYTVGDSITFDRIHWLPITRVVDSTRVEVLHDYARPAATVDTRLAKHDNDASRAISAVETEAVKQAVRNLDKWCKKAASLGLELFNNSLIYRSGDIKTH